MADPLSTQYLNATDEEKKRRLQDAEARAAATDQANQAYIGNLETAQAANNTAYDQATKNYNDLMAKYNNDFADMVQGESDRIRKEQEAARTMIQADQRAAQWTGLTELASSVANMIGVGSFNAANQQYRSYSQDWMKKADQDLREHRYRMDNIRARQNALKQQQLNLQMGQAGQALARENERIQQQYKDRMALAEAQRNAALQPMDIRSKAADEAGELGLKGMQTAAGIKAQEQATAQGWKRLQQQEDLKNAQIAKLNRTTSSSGATKGITLDVVIDGKGEAIRMSEKTYEEAIKRGVPELRRDVVENATKTLSEEDKATLKQAGIDPDNLGWDDFVALSGESKLKYKDANGKTRKVANPLHGQGGDIISAISGGSFDDKDAAKLNFETIGRYIKDNKETLNHTNKHLKNIALAEGAYGYYDDDEEEEEEENPPQNQKSIFDTVMNQ